MPSALNGAHRSVKGRLHTARSRGLVDLCRFNIVQVPLVSRIRVYEFRGDTRFIRLLCRGYGRFLKRLVLEMIPKPAKKTDVKYQ